MLHFTVRLQISDDLFFNRSSAAGEPHISKLESYRYNISQFKLNNYSAAHINSKSTNKPNSCLSKFNSISICTKATLWNN